MARQDLVGLLTGVTKYTAAYFCKEPSKTGVCSLDSDSQKR